MGVYWNEIKIELWKILYEIFLFIQRTLIFPHLFAANIFEEPTAEEFQTESLNKKNERILIFGSNESNVLKLDIFIGETAIRANISLRLNNQTLSSGDLIADREKSTQRILNVESLRLELREPFRRWRLSFRGFLFDEENKKRSVLFHSWWTATSDPHRFVAETPNLCRVAAVTDGWEIFERFSKREDFLQWGMIRSELVLDGGENMEMDFWGFRLRTLDSNPRLCRIVSSIRSVGFFPLELFQNGERIFDGEMANSSGKRFRIGRRFLGNHTEESPTGNSLFEETENLIPNRKVFRFDFEDKWEFPKAEIQISENHPKRRISTKSNIAKYLFSTNEIHLNGIEEHLKGIFDSTDLKFAVRSSAIGEDGTEMSAAGQLESFLNVEFKNIRSAVADCWASNFRTEILSYRKANKSKLNVPMGVIIQKMETDGIAGVMFTANPTTGDPTVILLNLVNGDGEILVSGKVTPSEFIISKADFSIRSETGEKLLEETELRKLAKIGLELEMELGMAVDVEFVWRRGEVFVVQSRPITRLDTETDWELEHEFDSGILNQRTVFSTANVGEVMPTPMTPLGCSTLGILYDRTIKSIFFSLNRKSKEQNIGRHFSTAILLYRQRIFLDPAEALLRNWESICRDDIPEYNLAGGKLFNEEMIEWAKERFPPKPVSANFFFMVFALKLVLLDSRRALKEAKELGTELREIAQISGDPTEILDRIKKQLDFLRKLIERHDLVSVFSSIAYAFVAMTLRGSAEGKVDSELLGKIATIYSKNTLRIESAEAPQLLKRIAESLNSDTKTRKQFEEFNNPTETMKWLKDSKTQTGELFREFLRDHGHRGPNELLLSGVAWRDDPQRLIQIIQSLIEETPNAEENSKTIELDSLIDQVDSEIRGIRRRFLRFLIPHAHRAIATRESAKSLIVLGTSIVRNSFRQLGVCLHQKKIIPSADLIFYFTISEISELLDSTDSVLLLRAQRRKRIFDGQCEQSYPLICVHKPVSLNNANFSDSTTKLKGTTVHMGRVVGRARVVRSLDEAALTENGEILITTHTDIAWSPLFPRIGGLVTEIGGLLSHGAVVAREFGLPSVIAVSGATQYFQTGDRVILDATKGTIEKVENSVE